MESKNKRLEESKKDIILIFENAKKRIFSVSDIDKILTENKIGWRLPKRTNKNTFINFLIKEHVLKEFKMNIGDRDIRKYIHKKNSTVSIYEIALSINPNSYISHYTAAYIHGLLKQESNIIYTNCEQT